MERKVGAISRGIHCLIIHEGDNPAKIMIDSVLDAAESEDFEIRDRDVISVTESVIAGTRGNYASIDAIAGDVKAKPGGETIGVIFPILSRNHFSIRLKGITKGTKKAILMFSYPSDGVGNSLVSLDQISEAGTSPYSDVLDLKRYGKLFGENRHSFTGVDYVAYYYQLIEERDAKAQVVFANNPREILNYTKRILTRDIHSRMRAKRTLEEASAEVVCSTDDVLNAPVGGSGCNEKHGLLGSNKSTEDIIKLFLRDCMDLVNDIQNKVLDRTRRHVEVMMYGNGAFKDPVGKIWELADPVISIASTEGLKGTPNEVKLRYLANNNFRDLSGEALKNAVSQRTKEKKSGLVGDMASRGTAPERFTDLIGSLCSLTSGSGNEGTSVTLIQGYFDNYTD